MSKLRCLGPLADPFVQYNKSSCAAESRCNWHGFINNRDMCENEISSNQEFCECADSPYCSQLSRRSGCGYGRANEKPCHDAYALLEEKDKQCFLTQPLEGQRNCSIMAFNHRVITTNK